MFSLREFFCLKLFQFSIDLYVQNAVFFIDPQDGCWKYRYILVLDINRKVELARRDDTLLLAMLQASSRKKPWLHPVIFVPTYNIIK